jgi:hypothetical protein
MIEVDLPSLAARLRVSRDRGVAWLVSRIDSEGKPALAETGPGWCRVPWALALSGETALASAVLGWAERHAIGEDGGFQTEALRGQGVMLSYPLGHLAIGAWLAERYDLALAIMSKLRTMIDPDTGGVLSGLIGPGGEQVQELLITAQVGVSALVTGQEDIIEQVVRWISDLYADQPDLPHKLYTMREGASLVTAPPAALTWLGLVDFNLPRQTFYNPGIAAAFLAGAALRGRDTVALGRRFLALNIGGTQAQYNDPEAVQICKFGWGASTMLLADPPGGHLPHVVRMAHWFMERQGADGAWAPSIFFSPKPAETELITKTAEHIMEVNTILAALGTAQVRL